MKHSAPPGVIFDQCFKYSVMVMNLLSNRKALPQDQLLLLYKPWCKSDAVVMSVRVSDSKAVLQIAMKCIASAVH